MGFQKKNTRGRSEKVDFFESDRFLRHCLLKQNDIIPLYSIGKDHKLYQGIKLFHFGSKSETILKDSMAQDIFNFTRISGVMECYFS